MRTFQVPFPPLLYVGYSSSSLLHLILRFHFISPTDLLNSYPKQHIITFHVFLIYVPNFILLFILSYNLFRNLSKYFLHHAQFRTDKSEILAHSVHIPTHLAGGHYRHHGIHLATKIPFFNV